MSENDEAPGPYRQPLVTDTPEKQAERPVDRRPMDDPAVSTLPELEAEIESVDSAAGQAAALLARSLTGTGRRRWFWRALLAGLGLATTALAAWLIESAIAAAMQGAVASLIGAIGLGLIGLGLLGLIAAEIVALLRLRSGAAVRGKVEAAVAGGKASEIDEALQAVEALHAHRPALEWALDRYRSAAADSVDAEERLELYERTVQGPLDEAALVQIVRIARRSGGLTTILPNPLLDIGVAVWSSVAVIRAVATVQGLRPGLLASGALLRRTGAAIAAAGAMELLHDVAPGVVAGTLLRRAAGRLGEGAINGVLIVRVGLAAIEATRLMPFRARARPSATAVAGRVFGLSPREMSKSD